MATKKSESVKTETKAAPTGKKAQGIPKAKRAPKAEAAAPKARHPKGKLAEAHGSKADLAKSLAGALSHEADSESDVAARLATASNAQLLRLSKVVAAVKSKWGGREKLIAAIGSAQNKSKDKDYLAKLASYSLPQLFDIAAAGERRARS
jgi:hypothetical protein